MFLQWYDPGYDRCCPAVHRWRRNFERKKLYTYAENCRRIDLPQGWHQIVNNICKINVKRFHILTLLSGRFPCGHDTIESQLPEDKHWLIDQWHHRVEAWVDLVLCTFTELFLLSLLRFRLCIIAGPWILNYKEKCLASWLIVYQHKLFCVFVSLHVTLCDVKFEW